MLRDLHVRNLAILEEVALEFGPGLNVLTGETGAGKSIVVDSLALLAGARASSDLVRSEADQLTVTGVFEPRGDGWRRALEAAGVDAAGDELVVRREIGRTGRNRVFLNDQPTTLTLLTRLAPALLRIHTQREELGLVEPELQRTWLDRSGGRESATLGRRTAERFEEYEAIRERLERVAGDDRLRQERIDLLRFQAGEIDAARPVAGEEESLRLERDLLRNAEAIREALGGSYALLFDDEGAAVERISRAERAIEGIASWQPEATAWVRELGGLRIGLEELASALREHLAAVAADPARLDAVEERLALLERLFRKYGGTSEELLTYREEIGRELAELEGGSELRDELATAAEGALAAYRAAAAELSEGRRQWGEALARRVHRELRDLAMRQARFSVRLETRRRESSALAVAGEPVEFSAHGYDQVTFELAANPGEEALPLARSASGGELSRIYLAAQLAARGNGAARAPALVFDEVDSGLGGAEAAALGRKLQRLARDGQILAVTHMPQVASHADQQFKVSKQVAGGRTRTRVDPLAPQARVEEIARMLAGHEVTDTSLSHAEELISSAERSR